MSLSPTPAKPLMTLIGSAGISAISGFGRPEVA